MSGLKRPGLSAHSLRSTSATLIMENGGTLLELQQHLGHKSPETTIRYLARLEKLADKAIEKFPFEVK
jgi:integrase